MLNPDYKAPWWSNIEIDWHFTGRFAALACFFHKLGAFEVAFTATKKDSK